MSLSLVVPGCGSTESSDQQSANRKAIVRTATDGPVSLTLTVAPEAVEVGQQATVTVEATAPRGVTVTVEDYRSALLEGDRRYELDVTNARKEEAFPLDDDRLAWRYRYTVSFLLAGTFEFPSASVRFVDTGDDQLDGADATNAPNGTPSTTDRSIQADSGQPVVDKEHELSTEPVSITAVDPSATALNQADLNDIKVLDPVELHRPVNHWIWMAALAALLLIVLAVALVRRQRRVLEQRQVVIPAHEWAWRQIAHLVADNLIEKGRVQEFYYRVSGIVRGYIERRFSLSAPEMTTEEFLHAAATDPRFDVEHRNSMATFLRACDLVKYARHVPQAGEADALLAAARTFVEQTRTHSTMEERYAVKEGTVEERAA